MKGLLVTVGALLALSGTVFLFQGLGFIPGSFMTSQTRWVYIGAAMDLAAIGLWIFAAWQSRKNNR